MEKYGTQMAILIWRMRIPCWTTKVTYTHSEYVMLICLCTAKSVTRTRLTATLYIHWLYFYTINSI